MMQGISAYSSSSSESEQIGKTPATQEHFQDGARVKPKLPPPPDDLEAMQFQNTTNGSGDVVDLPAVVPHDPREDKYLVHVSVPVHGPNLKSFVNSLMGKARLQLVGSPVKASFSELNDFHISVSRPASIRSNTIPELVSKLRHRVEQCRGGLVDVKPSISAFLSQNNRRLYLAAPIVSGSTRCAILDLISATDEVLQAFGLATFFDDPKPHMSFASTEKIEVLSQFNSICNYAKDEDCLQLKIEKVECSIGRSRYVFTLPK